MDNNEVIKADSPVTFADLPTSIQQALLANSEAIKGVDLEVEKTRAEIDETREKLHYAEQAGMATKGLKSIITRRQKHIKLLKRTRVAYQRGYIEIPNLVRDANTISTDLAPDGRHWNVTIPTSAPARVYKAVAEAVTAGTFERVVYYNDQMGDPIIAGVIGDRRFMVTAWR